MLFVLAMAVAIALSGSAHAAPITVLDQSDGTLVDADEFNTDPVFGMAPTVAFVTPFGAPSPFPGSTWVGVPGDPGPTVNIQDEFTVSNPSNFLSATLRVMFFNFGDVYLNGILVGSTNSSPVAGHPGYTGDQFTIASSSLLAGVNKLEFEATAGCQCSRPLLDYTMTATPIPEPGTYALFVSGLAAFVYARRRYRRQLT